MPRDIVKTVYKFDELSDKAKAKALDNIRNEEGFLHEDWWDFVYEDFQRVCEALGVDLATKSVPLMSGKTRQEPKIYFTGFYHQGSGSSFEGRYSHKEDCVEKIKEYAPQDEELHRIASELLSAQLRAAGNAVANVEAARDYYIRVEVGHSEDDDGVHEDVERDIRQALEDLNGWLYTQLETEYEYRMSDEAVQEDIEANEWEFDEDGDRV